MSSNRAAGAEGDGIGAHALPRSPMIAPDEFRQFQPRSRANRVCVRFDVSC
jgi:hypothetical protein